MQISEIKSLLHGLADEYPHALRSKQHSDVDRIAFHLHVVVKEKGRNCLVCDIGGGVGLFSVGCAALGIRAILVDDFGDHVNLEYGCSVLQVHKRHGVDVLSRDAIAEEVEAELDFLDVVTSFDSMEHWHHSPKRLFHGLVARLRDDGLFFLGVPNSVNLRKRVTVPFGIGKWSPMDEWYERKNFRGHVREPDVSDLLYIGRDLDLKEIKIFGRNWLGYRSRYGWVRALTPLGDRTLQLVPSLCSDIYLLGRKRERIAPE